MTLISSYKKGKVASKQASKHQLKTAFEYLVPVIVVLQREINKSSTSDAARYLLRLIKEAQKVLRCVYIRSCKFSRYKESQLLSMYTVVVMQI